MNRAGAVSKLSSCRNRPAGGGIEHLGEPQDGFADFVVFEAGTRDMNENEKEQKREVLVLQR